MATYVVPINDYANGSAPGADWGNPITRSGTTLTVTGTAPNKTLVLFANVAGTKVYSYIPLNGVTDVEGLAKFVLSSDFGKQGVMALRYSGNSEATTAGYIASGSFISSAGQLAIDEGQTGYLYWQPWNYLANVTYWVRFRVNGSTQQAKVWVDGNAEPGSWLVSGTDSHQTVGTFSGITNYSLASGGASDTISYSWLSFGTNGDPAPSLQPLKNQVGNARIEQITSRNQVGNSRITQTVSRAQVGNARITATTTRDQIGKAAVLRTVDKDQVGNTRIALESTRTQSGNARITAIPLRPQVGNANINNNTSRNQIGRTLVTVLTFRDQTGNARVQLTTSRDQVGNTRIEQTVSRTIIGRAAVLNVVSRAQTGNARIQRTTSRDQSGHTIIAREYLREQIGAAFIIRVNDYTTKPRVAAVVSKSRGSTSVINSRMQSDVQVSRGGTSITRPRVDIGRIRPGRIQ